MLFTVFSGDEARVELLDVRAGVRRALIADGRCPRYVRSGHLVYRRARSLEAVGFDLVRLLPVGTPAAILEGMPESNDNTCDFDVSHDGTLAYFHDSSGVPQRSLVWVDRQGREEPLSVRRDAYNNLRLSPDKTRVALDVGGPGQRRTIWVLDLARNVMQPVTDDLAGGRTPVWTPDGRHLVYSAPTRPEGWVNLFLRAADGSGAAERLTTSPNEHFASAVLADDRIIFREEPATIAT